jgi:hypothetical protein
MTQRAKLELPLNRPAEIELLYDEPITGRSQYGDYYMYAVLYEGEEYTFFAPEEVHNQIKNLGKGGRAVITKFAARRGSKMAVSYDVSLPDKPKNEEEKPQEESSPDKLYDLLLKSYEDAISIQKRLNGIIDIEKAAITLFIARSRINANTHLE